MAALFAGSPLVPGRWPQGRTAPAARHHHHRRNRPSLPPHPVAAPVALPAGQFAVAELQIEPVVVADQSAATRIADGEIDFIARSTVDVAERPVKRLGGIYWQYESSSSVTTRSILSDLMRYLRRPSASTGMR